MSIAEIAAEADVVMEFVEDALDRPRPAPPAPPSLGTFSTASAPDAWI